MQPWLKNTVLCSDLIVLLLSLYWIVLWIIFLELSYDVKTQRIPLVLTVAAQATPCIQTRATAAVWWAGAMVGAWAIMAIATRPSGQLMPPQEIAKRGTLWLWTMVIRVFWMIGFTFVFVGVWAHLCGDLQWRRTGVNMTTTGLCFIMPGMVVMVCGRARLLRIISDRPVRARSGSTGRGVCC